MLPALFVCLKQIARCSCNQPVMSSSLAMSLQLLATQDEGEPERSFWTMLIRICESPSISRGKRLCIWANCMPCHRPSSSTELLVSHPIDLKNMSDGLPLWSRKIPPNPASLGLPLDASSKLSFRKLAGGGIHVSGVSNWGPRLPVGEGSI